MKYVMLFVETEQYVKDLEAMSPEDRERAYAAVGEWFARHADRVSPCSKLQGPETATTVRLDGGDAVVMDGPFVEGKEVVSGFAEVDADDLDEVLDLARTWPGCPVVEVRPVLELPPIG
jgi:hypothetical protein